MKPVCVSLFTSHGGVKGGIIPPFRCHPCIASAFRRLWARELVSALRFAPSRSNCK